MTMKTRLAPEQTDNTASAVAMGMIGFDFYLLVIGASRDQLRAPKQPTF